MENSTALATVLATCISILGLIYLFFWRFSQMWIDEFRQSIFSVREELFDYAAAGNIDFNHPAYTSLRSLLNGYVRFSHRISALYFVSIIVWTAARNREFIPQLFTDTWEYAAANLDRQTKADLEAIRDKAGSHLLHFLFWSSYTKKALVLLSVIGPLLLIKTLLAVRRTSDDIELVAFRLTTEQYETVRLSFDQIDSEAYFCGKGAYAA